MFGDWLKYILQGTRREIKNLSNKNTVLVCQLIKKKNIRV